MNEIPTEAPVRFPSIIWSVDDCDAALKKYGVQGTIEHMMESGLQHWKAADLLAEILQKTIIKPSS